MMRAFLYLRPTLARLCRVLCKAPALQVAPEPPAEAAAALPAPAPAEPAVPPA